MFTVIILYCACWAPVKFFQMLNEYKFIQYCTQTDFLIVSYTYIVCHWLAMCNCFLNPLVYSFMSSSFRVIIFFGAERFKFCKLMFICFGDFHSIRRTTSGG